MREISQVKIARFLNKYVNNENDIPKIEINEKNAYRIFPFELVLGFITSTENGLRTNNSYYVRDYSAFKYVFTGLENIIARWEGAYKCYKANDDDLFLTKEYSYGREILGIVAEEQASTEFSTSPVDEVFTQEQINKRYVIQSNEKLSDEDKFKLYIIPQLDGQKWMRIAEVRNVFTINKKFHHCEIVFETINDLIAKSGRSVEEFIQRGAPGEGYAWPSIDENNEVIKGSTPISWLSQPLNEYEIISATINETTEIYTLTYYLEIGTTTAEEIQKSRYDNNSNVNDYTSEGWENFDTNTGGEYTTINYFVGENIEYTETIIYRVVDPNDTEIDKARSEDVPITSFQIELAGAVALGSLYCYGRPTILEDDGTTAFNPKIEAPRMLLPYAIQTPTPSPLNIKPNSESDWFIGEWIPTLTENYQDWKEAYEANYDLTQRTQYEGFLQSVSTQGEIEGTNPITGGSRANLMWDENWAFFVNKDYDTSTDSFTGANLPLNQNLTLPELLCHNIFALSRYTALPLQKEQNITWQFSDIPIIGGFLNQLTFGVPIGWNDNAIRLSMDGIMLITPCVMTTYGNVLLDKNTNDDDPFYVDLTTLTDETTNNDAVNFSGIKSLGSIFKVELTDQFKKNGTTYNTRDLGQVVNGTTLLWDETCVPVPRDTNTPGFVIDTTFFQAVAKMDYRLTLYSNATEAWSGTYQTTAKYTNNTRDWTNSMKMSFWNEDNGQTISYPAIITEPLPPEPDVNVPSVEYDPNWNNLFDYYLVDSKNQDTYNVSNLEGLALVQKTNGLYIEKERATPDEMWESKDYPTIYLKDYNWTDLILTAGTINFKDYGGENYVRTNYKEIKIHWNGEFSTADYNNKIITLNIDDIINSGQQDYQLSKAYVNIEIECETNVYAYQLKDEGIFYTTNLFRFDYENEGITIKSVVQNFIDMNNRKIDLSNYSTINDITSTNMLPNPNLFNQFQITKIEFIKK